jgi:hypothetical protein
LNLLSKTKSLARCSQYGQEIRIEFNDLLLLKAAKESRNSISELNRLKHQVMQICFVTLLKVKEVLDRTMEKTQASIALTLIDLEVPVDEIVATQLTKSLVKPVDQKSREQCQTP